MSSASAVYAIVSVALLSRRPPPPPGAAAMLRRTPSPTLTREEAVYWRRIHRLPPTPKTAPLDEDAFFQRVLEVNTRLAEPFPYRWRRPLSKRLVGADAMECVARAAEVCAQDYLDLLGNLAQMQRRVDTLQDEDSLLGVADKYFGVSPLVDRIHEIIHKELHVGSGEQLALVLQHPPTIWALFLTAVSKQLRARAQQPWRSPRPAVRKPWAACIEWRLLQRLSTLANSLWEAERQVMVAQAVRSCK